MMLNTANPVPRALRTMRDAIARDPGYKEAWIANLAMFMFDNLADDRLNDRAFREALADRLLKLIF